MATPVLVSQSFSGNTLLLNWQCVNTQISCTGYSVELEIVPINTAFTGTAFFYSPNLTKTITPQAYPQQSISISSTVCPGTVYQFRARETDGALVSYWTSVFTFTIPYTTPVLNVSPAPNSFSVVCASQQVQFNATISQSSGSQAYTYSWQPSAGLSCTNCSNPVLSPYSNNSYTCTVSNGCWTVNKKISTFAPVLQIVPGPSVICVDDMVSLTVNGSASYTWSNGYIGDTLVDIPLGTTVYTVAGKVSGCTGTASFTQYVEVCSGIHTVGPLNDPVSIYPNPSSGSFIITASRSMSVELFNELGQPVQKIVLNQPFLEAEIGHLPPGIYFLTGIFDAAIIRKSICVLK